MFSDKTQHNIQMAKAMTYQLRFIDELYHAVENRFEAQLYIYNNHIEDSQIRQTALDGDGDGINKKDDSQITKQDM
jgi:hypothetical protein